MAEVMLSEQFLSYDANVSVSWNWPNASYFRASGTRWDRWKASTSGCAQTVQVFTRLSHSRNGNAVVSPLTRSH